MSPRYAIALGIGFLAGALSGCVSDRPAEMEPPPPGSQDVAIRDFTFIPPDVTVEVGGTVLWTNEDGAPHTATARDGSFDSSSLSRGQSFQLRATRVGTFEYFCEVHPGIPSMRGTLRVTP